MSGKCRLVLLLLLGAVSCIGVSTTVAADYKANVAEKLDLCESPIYCQGELLKTVQLAAIEPDSKTFVDYSQKNDEEVTLANFNSLMKKTKNSPSKDEVRQFVEENFLSVDELENATLTDWNPHPELMNQVQDPLYRQWVADLNEIWKGLAKRMTTDVRDKPKRHSLIYVNNTFIIPGGRFKEFYYWDSYWVLEGLLLHGMSTTAKGILENFLSIVQTYGFIPNGGRIYYLMRSQLPLLIPMVDKYYEITKDLDFVLRHLETLEKEFNFWMRYKTVKVRKYNREYVMARYVVNSEGPRPESYREDYLLAINITDPVKKRAFYNNIKAGAETGWDYSARWFIAKNGDPSTDFRDINTEDIIPVDLNSFIESNARTLARYFRAKNDVAKVRYYESVAKKWREAIEDVLWNEKDGTWYDYDAKHQRARNLFYPSNLTPLYTMSYNWKYANAYGYRAVRYLRANGITEYPGGVPTSLDNTGQQWDLPNAWAPLQSIVVQGLKRTNYQPAMDMAKNLALTWLHSNYLAFNTTQKMYEKYNAVKPGEFGGGGEYPVQDGFGWSNGVVLEFLATYPWAKHRDVDRRPMKQGTTTHVRNRIGLNQNTSPRQPHPMLKSTWTYYCQH